MNKPFGDMTLDDLLGYLEILKKPESLDPDQSWRGLFLVIITRFFKWLYYPDTPPDERPKPDIVAGLKKARPKGGKRRNVGGRR